MLRLLPALASFSRVSVASIDDYALGVMTFQTATGEFPPLSSRRRAAIYHRVGCPDSLRSEIDDVLEC